MMHLNEMIQMISSLTSIATILVGSLWLKQYLRANLL